MVILQGVSCLSSLGKCHTRDFITQKHVFIVLETSSTFWIFTQCDIACVFTLSLSLALSLTHPLARSLKVFSFSFALSSINVSLRLFITSSTFPPYLSDQLSLHLAHPACLSDLCCLWSHRSDLSVLSWSPGRDLSVLCCLLSHGIDPSVLSCLCSPCSDLSVFSCL